MLYQLIGLITLTHMVSICTSNTFDYIIVGGGPAGLVLANRLSSNSSLNVAVIEAGDSVFNNPNVTSVASYGLSIGTSIDWGYTSAPQKYTSNRKLGYNAGKALGGTTTINGMTYLRAEKAQIDAWEQLGNEGWNWDGLWPFYLKQESFHVPDDSQRENGATFQEETHGFDGELAVGWSKYFMGQNMFSILRETSDALGYPFNLDANDGSMRGFTTWPFTLNATDNIREDAARAYYYPIAPSRPNLHVYLNTIATRIIWDESSRGDARTVARGVEILSSSNSTTVLQTRGEVILSAGSIRSPALLELSGVGNPAILEPLGIKTVVSLPGVGSNLQDQPNTLLGYSSPTNWTGYPSFVTYVTAADLFGSELKSISEEISANISDYASKIVSDLTPNTTTSSIQEHLLRIQFDVIFKPESTVPLAELIWFPSSQSIALAFWNLLPFSRGSIHIASKDARDAPIIDPNFFQLPIDQYIQAAAAQRLRQYFATPPLSNHVISEVIPNFSTVPEGATFRNASWGTWMKNAYGSNQHPVSTCAMMDRKLGGVVDNKGRVYGTANVRVVDASIMPMQVSGHLSSTVYAIAEKIASSILKERCRT